MLKNHCGAGILPAIRLNAALSVAWVALVAGCSPTQPPVATSPSPQSDASRSSVNQTESRAAEAPGSNNTPWNSVSSATKQRISLAVPPNNPIPATNAEIQQYINVLAAKGFAKETQGVWIQSGNTLLANHQGTVPLPAASVTKVATTLAALQTFGPEHQFVTLIQATGPIENGDLQGDLVIQGGEDPFFVWEEAVAVGNLLNQMGIKRVTGDLVIVGKFYMNFKADPQTAGNMLKLGLNSQSWPAEAQTQFQTLPPGTPRPVVAIAGSVQVSPSTPSNSRPLVRHFSFPLAELLKKMNSYSNNFMADMLANSVGGAKVVSYKAAAAAGVPQAEIQVINGSGLGLVNRVSPRAAIAMFLAIERYLQSSNMTVADIFTVVGQDEGILSERQLPPLSVVKSGTLNNVSALAGALPTQKQGTVWFAIMNVGENLQGFRTQQEALLKGFRTQWGAVQSLPPELTPNPTRKNKTSSNEIVQ